MTLSKKVVEEWSRDKYEGTVSPPMSSVKEFSGVTELLCSLRMGVFMWIHMYAKIHCAPKGLILLYGNFKVKKY
jgi:hypothetical protein